MNAAFPDRLRWRWALVAVLAVGLSACAWMQNDLPQKPLIKPQQIHLADDIHLANEGWPAAQWWTRFGDPQLNALIARGLRDSPSLRVARARVEQARATVELAAAGRQPIVAGVAGASRQWVNSSGTVGPISINTPIPGLTGGGSTQSGTIAAAGVLAGYNFDVWGLQSSLLNAAVGAKNAQLAETAAAQLKITTTIAQTYFSMQTTMRKLALLEKVRDILADSVAGMEARQQRGLVTATDVSKAKQQLIETKQLLSAAQMQVTDLREALRTLVGAGAKNFPAIEPRPLPTPEPRLPATLSYSLLSHRPDLVVLRWYVQSSLDQVAAAKAAFYPSFNIKAFLGFSHINLGDVVDVSTRQFSLIPGLTLPLFDGGRLNANLHKARASSNALIEQYNQAVLNAVSDVAVAATNMQSLEEQTRLEQKKYEALQQSAEDATAHMQRGLISQLAGKQAQIPLLKEKAKLADTWGRRLAAEISLITALGGGYDLPADQLPPPPKTRSAPEPASETALPQREPGPP